MSNHRVVILSGLSGSGKTTLGNYFVNLYNDWTFIDGDWFFLRDKPKVLLSNGDIVPNWDSPDAIDWDLLNDRVNRELVHYNIILATFLPIMDKFTFPIYKHIRLSMGSDEQLIKRCIQARKASKKFNTPEKIKRDELMVREVVYPIYLSNEHWHTDNIFMVYDDEGNRVPLGELNTLLENVIL